MFRDRAQLCEVCRALIRRAGWDPGNWADDEVAERLTVLLEDPQFTLSQHTLLAAARATWLDQDDSRFGRWWLPHVDKDTREYLVGLAEAVKKGPDAIEGRAGTHFIGKL